MEVAQTGFAQVLDTTNYTNQLNQQSQSMAAMMIKRQQEAEKERRSLLKEMDVDISKALLKRGEELQKMKDQAMVESAQTIAEKGNTAEARVEIVERMTDLKRKLHQAIAQQKMFDGLRQRVETGDPRKIDREASLENLKTLSRLGIEETEEWDQSLIVLREPNLTDDLKRFSKQLIPSNRDLTPEQRYGMITQFASTEDGVGFVEDHFDGDFEKARTYLQELQDFQYNKYKASSGSGGSGASVIKTGNFNKFGEIKGDTKDFAKVAEEVSGSVIPAAPEDVAVIGGADVPVEFKYTHGLSTQVSVPALKVVGASGQQETLNFNGKWHGYVRAGGQDYAVYYKGESPGTFDFGSRGQQTEFYYSPVNERAELEFRKNTYKAYLKGVQKIQSAENDIYFEE